jgi:hypothetical protein
VGPHIENVILPRLDKDAWPPSGLPGADMVGAWDGSWGLLCVIWLFLATKPSHVGADVDGPACYVHPPTVCGWQM